MDKHHTFSHWYVKKGLIVASRSIESLADELGASEKPFVSILSNWNRMETSKLKRAKLKAEKEKMFMCSVLSMMMGMKSSIIPIHNSGKIRPLYR